jgi:PAS domain S-box-containing protein
MIVISDKIINLTGYTAEDFITHRRSILDLVHEKDKGNVYKFMQRQIDENIEIEMEFRIIDRFGALHWIYEKSSVFVDEEELVRYIDGIFEDITQRKENELEIEQYKMHLEKLVNIRTKRLKEVNEELQETLKELKSAQGNLVQAEKMASLGVLTAGVAHELNNPLNFIQGGYTGLERLIEESEGFPKEEGTVMMNSIKEGLRRAVNIVKSLNQFSRTRDANNEWCRIHSILDNCILMLNHEIKHKITLNKNYQAVHDLLEGNSGKLHQVFINVLTNAIQAIDNKGEVEICTSNENENIKIEITDTGCGISPQNLGKVTDPFFTTKGPGEGTGLGLSISYKIIKEHRGTIFLKSVETKGTTVTIELPVLNCG